MSGFGSSRQNSLLRAPVWKCQRALQASDEQAGDPIGVDRITGRHFRAGAEECRAAAGSRMGPSKAPGGHRTRR